jgi:hypothetical protein
VAIPATKVLKVTKDRRERLVPKAHREAVDIRDIRATKES